MILTTEEENRVKSSFSLLRENDINIAKIFYDNLFEMAPLIKPMFKSERNTIEMHFYELVNAAVNEIDHFEEFKPRLIALGVRHKKYGAQRIHFRIIKASFILSIQSELKASFILSIQSELKGSFNEPSKVAWSKYLDNISEAMNEGLSA